MNVLSFISFEAEEWIPSFEKTFFFLFILNVNFLPFTLKLTALWYTLLLLYAAYHTIHSYTTLCGAVFLELRAAWVVASRKLWICESWNERLICILHFLFWRRRKKNYRFHVLCVFFQFLVCFFFVFFIFDALKRSSDVRVYFFFSFFRAKCNIKSLQLTLIIRNKRGKMQSNGAMVQCRKRKSVL